MQNLPEIAQQIATQLGCTVLPDGNEYFQQVAGAEVPFSIYTGYGTDKLSISLCYPRTADNTLIARDSIYPAPVCPNIKVSATRAPAAIAADIKRRFIPAAKLVYAACMERVKQNDEYGTTCLTNGQDIANACNDSDLRQETKNSHVTVNFSVAGLSGRAEVRRDEATVTLRGTIDDITKALALLSKV